MKNGDLSSYSQNNLFQYLSMIRSSAPLCYQQRGFCSAAPPSLSIWRHCCVVASREMQQTLCHLIWVAVRAAADWWVISRRFIENESAAISIIDCFSDFSSKTCQVFPNVRICCLSFTIVNNECLGFGRLVGLTKAIWRFSFRLWEIFPSFFTFHFHFN